MSAILENLRMDHKCLLRMMEQAGFAGNETGIRVRDPQMLSDALASSIKEIERLQLALDHWRQEVGKKASQIDRLSDENKRLRDALSAVNTWADQRCPCRNEEPNPCPLCGADANKTGDICLSAENTFPRDLLTLVRDALGKAGA